MDVFSGYLESYCFSITSSKVTERRKSIDKLAQLLCNKLVIEDLNSGRSFTWDSVLQAVHIFLQKVLNTYIVKDMLTIIFIL